MKLLIQHGDLLNGGFLRRNASHLEFQPSDVLTRPGGDHRLCELEVFFPGEYVSEDVRSIKGASFGSAMPVGDAEVDANDADIFAGESVATEGAGWGETRRRLGNDLLAAT